MAASAAPGRLKTSRINRESAVEETSRRERKAILEQRRRGTVQVHGIYRLYQPAVVDLDSCT
jgi:hypothetical protein